MIGFIKKILAMIFLVSSVNSLKCILIRNQECKVRKVMINNEYMLYPYSIKVNRCNGNCNNISNPYSRVCVPSIVKNMTLRVFDLMSWKNKTKQIQWHKSGKCECRLDPIICNNEQKWNKDKCRCECKKLLLLKKYNKTVSIKENTVLVSCKPFVASSILVLLVSVITASVFVYFSVNLQPKRKLQDYY